MSLLDIPVVVPIWIIVLPIIAFMCTGAYFLYYWFDNRKFCPELGIFKKARKRGLPILKIHTHSGWFKRVLGEKEKKGSIIFKFDANSHEGIRIDPGIQASHVPKSMTIGGLQEIDYSTSSPFPMSAKEATAYDNILKYIRETYPVLDMFDGQTVLEYVRRPRNVLSHDCRNLAKTTDIKIDAPQEDLDKITSTVTEQIRNKIKDDDIEISEEELVKLIETETRAAQKRYIIEFRGDYLAKVFMAIQDETSELLLPAGKFFSFPEAFLNTASAWTGFDLQTMFHYFKQLAELNKHEQLKWMVALLIGSGVFIALLAFAYVLIQTRKG